MPYKNKEDQLECQRRYYRNHRKTMIERTNKRAKEIRKWWKEYKKTQKCEKCGENHPACICFHHRDPEEKDIDLSTAVTHNHWGEKRIKKELLKCDVICSNCHLKIHWND